MPPAFAILRRLVAGGRPRRYKTPMSLTLHAHPLSSYCWKVLIALYENETEFAFHQLEPGDATAAAAFRELWPIGKMPVLVDDRRAIVESSIIIEYLGLHHPGPVRMVPDDSEAALEVRLLDRIFDQYVMTPMQKIVFDRIRGADARDPAGGSDARRLIDTSYGWLEKRIGKSGWAAGEDFTLADCAAAPSLHYADEVQPMADRFPRLAAFLERLRARPSFARVVEEAEPYRHLFPSEP